TYVMLQESQLYLQDIVKQLNQQKLDFVIFGGDQVEHPGPDDQNWQLFLDVLQSLSVPWSFVLGEQDVSGSRPVDKMHTYGPDWKGKGIETETPYWSQSPLPGVHLIGLDTSNPNSTAGEISPEQLEWLKNDLKKNARRFTIVFSHHPLLPPPPFDGGPPWDQYITAQGASAREILGSSKYVRLALSGHVHMTKLEKEGEIWYVSNPSLGVFPCAFRLFHVTPDEITIETYTVQFPALIKKARQLFATSPLAYKYNERKPDTYCALADGDHLDWSCRIPLAQGGQPEPIKVVHKKKHEAQPTTTASEEPHKRGFHFREKRAPAAEKAGAPERKKGDKAKVLPPDKSVKTAAPVNNKAPTTEVPDKDLQPIGSDASGGDTTK
ncbi:MAG: metallophosphoesterase family protein, partial [Terriglobales bacterium]